MLNKIMHFIIIILLSNINASIVGEYRLTGLNVVDYDFCRQSTDIKVIEKSGFSLDSLIVYTIPQGKSIDYDVRDPYPLFALNAAGVDLWVYFAEDGTATVLEGSTYPTENAGEGCFTEEIALPIQEDFSYTANLNSNEFIPVVDILGIESFSPYKGIESGSISITGSSVFDIVPINPTNLTIPFPIDTSSVYNNNNGMIASNTILPGVSLPEGFASSANSVIRKKKYRQWSLYGGNELNFIYKRNPGQIKEISKKIKEKYDVYKE